MASGWDVYSVIFLSGGLALLIPVGLAAVSAWIAPGKSGKLPAPPASRAQAVSRLGQKTNTRYFLGVYTAVLLLALVLILVPIVVVFTKPEDSAPAFVAVATVVGLALLSVLYGIKKGTLDWLMQDGPTRKRED